MSSFPGSPKILKGGLVFLDPVVGTVLRIIPLQYNPDTLTRSLDIKGVGADSGDQMEAQRLKGPPVETIKLEAEIDATDQLETGDPATAQTGLHPVLAALETTVYPSSTQLTVNAALAMIGTLEILPSESPLTLFIFGPQRIVPVRLTELSITEEAFDVLLNPIRAKISLGMRVLSVDDVGFLSKGGSMFMSYLHTKERFASQNKPGTLGSLGVTNL